MISQRPPSNGHQCTYDSTTTGPYNPPFSQNRRRKIIRILEKIVYTTELSGFKSLQIQGFRFRFRIQDLRRHDQTGEFLFRIRPLLCKRQNKSGTKTFRIHHESGTISFVCKPSLKKSCPGQEGHPPSRVNFTERLNEKKVDPFARAKSWPFQFWSCSDCLALTELTWLGEPKCLYGEKLSRLGGWSYHRKTEGDTARRVTLLAEPTFCFSCKQLTKFCEEMYEKLARPG